MCRTKWHHLSCVKEGKQQQQNMRLILLSQRRTLQIVTKICHTIFFLPASNSGVHSNKSTSRVRSKIMSPYRSLNRIVPELKQGLRKVLSGCLKQVGFPIVHYIPVTL